MTVKIPGTTVETLLDRAASASKLANRTIVESTPENGGDWSPETRDLIAQRIAGSVGLEAAVYHVGAALVAALDRQTSAINGLIEAVRDAGGVS